MSSLVKKNRDKGLLVWITSLRNKYSSKKDSYKYLIVDQGVISIIEMTTLLKKDIKITRIDIQNVKKEVQKLIDSKYLSDYYIDEKRLLVLKKSPPLQSQPEEHPYSRIKSRKKRNLKSFKETD